MKGDKGGREKRGIIEFDDWYSGEKREYWLKHYESCDEETLPNLKCPIDGTTLIFHSHYTSKRDWYKIFCPNCETEFSEKSQNTSDLIKSMIYSLDCAKRAVESRQEKANIAREDLRKAKSKLAKMLKLRQNE